MITARIDSVDFLPLWSQPNMLALKPKAYAYLRFSSMAQEEGDSIRRQWKAILDWCGRNAVELDDSLGVDRGKSGLKAEHLKRGHLGEFVRQVEMGNVAPGSYLVVESLDRLTREHPQDGLRLLLNLLHAGIRVVQLIPTEVVYDRDSGTMQLLIAIFELSRGHGESKVKQNRVSEVRREQRQEIREGRKKKYRHPEWLRWECSCLSNGRTRHCKCPEARYVEIPERCAVVRRMFELSREGHGGKTIARFFDSEKVPTFCGSAHWSASYIHRVLRDGRAAGFFQPKGPGRRPEGEAVGDYYPAVVSVADWTRARSGLLSRRKGGRGPSVGTAGSFVNPLTGLVRDAVSGDRLQAAYAACKKYRYRVLTLPDRRGNADGPFNLRYDVFRRAILSRLDELDPRDVLDAAPDARKELTALRTRLDEARLSRATIEEGLAVRATPTLVQAAARVDDQIAELEEQVRQAQEKERTPLTHWWDEAKDLLAAIEGSAAPERSRREVRLRTALRAMIEGIWVVNRTERNHQLTAAQVRFVGGGVRDYLIAFKRRMPGRPARWHVGSLDDSVAGEIGLDLRRADHVAGMRKWLRRIRIEDLPMRDFEER